MQIRLELHNPALRQVRQRDQPLAGFGRTEHLVQLGGLRLAIRRRGSSPPGAWYPIWSATTAARMAPDLRPGRWKAMRSPAAPGTAAPRVE